MSQPTTIAHYRIISKLGRWRHGCCLSSHGYEARSRSGDQDPPRSLGARSGSPRPIRTRSQSARVVEPKNGSSSPSTAAGPNVNAAAGCIAQSPVGPPALLRHFQLPSLGLNHPNIGQIHGVEKRALIMAFVPTRRRCGLYAVLGAELQVSDRGEAIWRKTANKQVRTVENGARTARST